MSAIIAAVFKATIGLIVNKGRDAAAERLKEGDVADQRFRGMIVREIEDIKTRLDGLARMAFLAAIDAFEAGLRYLYQAIDTETGVATLPARQGIEGHLKEMSSPSASAAMKTVSLTAGIRNMEHKELSDKTKRALSEAKDRFKMAREEATKAFNNEALTTFNRVTAIRYRVMSTILESAVATVGTTGDLTSLSVQSVLENALPECEQCLQKLHSLSDVQNNFKVELEKGLLNIKAWFSKDERREIIYTVCQVNKAIYDAPKTASKEEQVWAWPLVDIGEDKIDPLRDDRVANVLSKVGMEHFCVRPWSFGQEGEKDERLQRPRAIVTNWDEQFIVADDRHKCVKVFDSSGKFLHSISLRADADFVPFTPTISVATDANRKLYMLISYMTRRDRKWRREVQVYNSAGDLLLKFPLSIDTRGRIAVNSTKVFVLTNTTRCKAVVEAYKQDGGYVCSFGEETLKDASDIIAYNDRIMILNQADSCIHVFNEDGQEQYKFNFEGGLRDCSLGCLPEGKHVFVGGQENDTGLHSVAVYTKGGEFVRKLQLREEAIRQLKAITVTKQGRIAMAVVDEHYNGKVIVI